MTRVPRLFGAVLAGALVSGALLSGCSGDDSPSSDGGEPTGSTSTSASPYLPVPSGVDLTAPGAQLKVGDTATVAFRPRQGQVGVLNVTVTRLERTTFKQSFSGWQLDATTRKSTPYFVHAAVKNVGRTNLAGRTVPLYGADADNVLLQPTTFQSAFKPCPSTPLPKPFRTGDRQRICLVYLAPHHGKLQGVSFALPDESGFQPITWTGKIEKLKPAKAGKKGAKKGGRDGGKKGTAGRRTGKNRG